MLTDCFEDDVVVCNEVYNQGVRIVETMYADGIKCMDGMICSESSNPFVFAWATNRDGNLWEVVYQEDKVSDSGLKTRYTVNHRDCIQIMIDVYKSLYRKV